MSESDIVHSMRTLTRLCMMALVGAVPVVTVAENKIICVPPTVHYTLLDYEDVIVHGYHDLSDEPGGKAGPLFVPYDDVKDQMSDLRISRADVTTAEGLRRLCTAMNATEYVSVSVVPEKGIICSYFRCGENTLIATERISIEPGAQPKKYRPVFVDTVRRMTASAQITRMTNATPADTESTKRILAAEPTSASTPNTGRGTYLTIFGGLGSLGWNVQYNGETHLPFATLSGFDFGVSIDHFGKDSPWGLGAFMAWYHTIGNGVFYNGTLSTEFNATYKFLRNGPVNPFLRFGGGLGITFFDKGLSFRSARFYTSSFEGLTISVGGGVRFAFGAKRSIFLEPAIAYRPRLLFGTDKVTSSLYMIAAHHVSVTLGMGFRIGRR